jgi:hypothetical protein
MLLQLDDNFRITKDKSEMNFQLEKLESIKDRESGTMKQEFKVIGYHGNSMRSVLLQYKKESLFAEDDFKAINQVLDKLKDIEKTIETVVTRENIKLVAQND